MNRWRGSHLLSSFFFIFYSFLSLSFSSFNHDPFIFQMNLRYPLIMSDSCLPHSSVLSQTPSSSMSLQCKRVSSKTPQASGQKEIGTRQLRLWGPARAVFPFTAPWRLLTLSPRTSSLWLIFGRDLLKLKVYPARSQVFTPYLLGFGITAHTLWAILQMVPKFSTRTSFVLLIHLINIVREPLGTVFLMHLSFDWPVPWSQLWNFPSVILS